MGGASRAPKVRRVPSSASAAPQSSAGFVDPTPPFPTGGVPGTHPDSVIPTASMLNNNNNAGGANRAGAGAGAGRSVATDNTQRSRADLLTQGQASSEAGPSSSSSMRNAPSTQAEPAPATTAGPKKVRLWSSLADLKLCELLNPPRLHLQLVRRARTGRTAVLDLLDDPADEPERRSAPSKGYQTQDYAAAGTQSAGSSSSRLRATESPAVADGPDENGAGGSLAAPPRTGRLARRAGQKSAVQAFLDDDGDAGMTGEGSGGASENQSAGGRNRATKSKEERMREIREEDERRAKEEAERYEQRKAQEENEAQAGKGSRGRQRAAAPTAAAAAATAGKKRGKSAALSDDGDSDDVGERQPARKLASRKDGDAPVATTSKRSRDMARAAQNSSSSDEGDRQARKKSKGPSAAAGSPKSKKEMAAQRKAAKEAEELDRKRLLQVKTTKRKGVEIDKELNEDFNALKIVKPVMKSMPPVDKHRMAWDEEDSDAERDRLIRADQERAQRGASDDDEMDPNHWRQATQAMFVVRPMHIEPKPHRKENEPPHDDPRWAGKPNFKRFRVSTSPASTRHY